MNIEVVRKKFRAKNNLHARKKEKKMLCGGTYAIYPAKRDSAAIFYFEVTENHCSVANRGSH